MLKRLLTVEQISELTQLPPDEIRRLARRGEIPGYKIGHYWRFSEAEIIAKYGLGGVPDGNSRSKTNTD